MDSVKLRNARDFLKEEIKKYFNLFLIIFVVVFIATQAGLIVYSRGANSAAEAVNIGQKVEAPSRKGPDAISIPKLNVEAPLIIVNSADPKDFTGPLKKGVTHFPSALPGQKGTAIILGHSAPPGWPKINYDWVFSDINDLVGGDEILVFFENKEYKYVVREKIFLEKGQDVPQNSAENVYELAVISCWPPGIDNKRIVVLSDLVRQ